MSDIPKSDKLFDSSPGWLINRLHRFHQQSGNLMTGLRHQRRSLDSGKCKDAGRGLETGLPPG